MIFATTISVAPGPFLAIAVVGALAATVSVVVTERVIVMPVVVVELLFGVGIGPKGLGLHDDEFINFFSSLGLGLLFYFAGYEIDLRRIAGAPLRLAGAGWIISLAIAYAIGGLLVAAGVVHSALYVGSAISTTALGTLLPILSDSGALRTRLGSYLLAAGAVGEFGPILLLTLILATQSPLHNALILVLFLVATAAVAVFVVRSSGRTLPILERTLERSAQLAIRWVVVLIFGLAMLAYKLGLDLLLGDFAAGLIVRQALGSRSVSEFDSKMTAIAFGVFVPFFFIVSGMKLDVHALFSSVAGVVKIFIFFTVFLIVRGLPALMLYRHVLGTRERAALALMSSTQLPLVLAITTLALQTGHMRASTAAALVGAAVLSTLAFPIIALKLRDQAETGHVEGDELGVVS